MAVPSPGFVPFSGDMNGCLYSMEIKHEHIFKEFLTDLEKPRHPLIGSDERFILYILSYNLCYSSIWGIRRSWTSMFHWCSADATFLCFMPHIATVRDVAEGVPIRNPSRKQSNSLPFWRRETRNIVNILSNTQDLSNSINQCWFSICLTFESRLRVDVATGPRNASLVVFFFPQKLFSESNLDIACNACNGATLGMSMSTDRPGRSISSCLVP
jgi:hypothetical protein